ncbi:DEKNAAC103574 [Brettanomyces naardenensis]|uniref:BRO domain-containing protein 1 n=1 Tax=Brettanomyces naardenensis TaxID=13370 RepID=A0A448YNJ8_BRENA|nr:DEKNAAC103574 [Brettanomyces naardenensis]
MKFITIPLKKAEPTDWVHPLKSYLAQIYGSYSDFEDSIHEFDKLRTDLIHASKDNIAKELYYHYYGQLELLELRIPMDLLRIEFTWHDAFEHSLKTKQHSVAFEKASVLFNLASLLSSLASQSAPDNLKESYTDFQRAAGVYQFIQENFMHAPSIDMNVDTVKAFSKLMLAQAQEAFLLKYISSGTGLKNSLCSKLAQSTSNLYGASYELTQHVNYVPPEQDDYCKLKQLYYQSVAHYYNGKALTEKEEYGDAIANLRAAQEDLESYGAYGGSFDYTILETMKDHLDTVEAELKTLDKDNDFIYHQNVPKTVPTIKALNSSKAIPLHEQQIDSMVGHDLFEKIIPMSVHEKSSLYSEEKAQILRAEDDHCGTADEEFNSALEFLRLPQSLVELRQLSESDVGEEGNDSEVDPRVLAISSEISSTKADLSNAQRIRRDVVDTLDRCAQLLDEDGSHYEANRAEYGAQWTQEMYPSELIQIKEDLGKAKKSLVDAGESDSKIQQLYDSSRDDINLLKLGPSNSTFLASFGEEKADQKLATQMSLLDIDEGPKSSTAAIQKKLSLIDSKLQELRRLQKERSNTLNDLKKSIRDDDISNLLVLNKDKDNLDDVFNQELQKFKPYQDRIAATVDKQVVLINTLKQLMAEVLDDPSVKATRTKREKMKGTNQAATARYLEAYEAWKAYKSGCDQAPAFYKQLLQFSTNLKYKIEKYAGQRANEANRLLQSIQARSNTEQELLRQRMNQYSVSSSPHSSVSSQPLYPQNYPSGYQVPPPAYQAQPPAYERPPVPTWQSSSGGSPSTPPAPASASPGSSYAPPPVPSKPGSQQNTDFYHTPSAYDPSLYSKFGSKNWNQRRHE